MTKMANESMGLKVLTNPHSPDIFFDEAIGFEVLKGTVRIQFAVSRQTEAVPPSKLQFVTIGRLITTIEGAQNLSVGLFNFLKSQGFDPLAMTSGGEKAN